MSNYVPGAPSGALGFLTDIQNKFKASGLTARTKLVKDTEAAITKAKAALTLAQKNAALKEAEIVAYRKAQNPKLKPEGSGTPTASQKQALDKLQAQKQEFVNQATKEKANIATLENNLKKFKADLATYNKVTFPPEKDPVIISSADADKLIYQYNAPMLKSAYLNPFGPQGNSLPDKNLIGAPVNDFNNARLAWKGVTPSRGTIQMSRIFAENAKAPQTPAKGQKKNTTPYGFRFLYNPTDVSMAWGIVDAFSPEYAQSNENGMSGVAVGLMKGTIAFTLLLNRVNDMNVLDANGIKATVDTSLIPNNVDAKERNAIYDNLYRDINPYPTTVPVEDQQTIFKKGTMYDLEYLFRAMGGYYADYESGLNGKTADRGWLQPIPMELHLGAGLRYLVRVSSLDLKHMMFNERMVPTLTTVNIVCTRYYDSPDAFKDPTSIGADAYKPEG